MQVDLTTGTVRVALVSIGHCPSLATRNLRRFCLAHADVHGRAEFFLFDCHLREFLRSHVESTQRWSFATRADELLSRLLELRPTIIAFSCYLWNTETSIRLASQIRRLLPDVQIVFGGPDVGGPRAKWLLERHAELDVIVDGDGEIPFLELVRRHIAGEPRSLAGVPSVTYRAGNEIVRSAATAGSPDLSLLTNVFDDLPSAAELGRWGWPNILYETMRGCPYQCSFCMYGKIPPNRKDVATVVEEVTSILSRGLSVEFIDPTFTTYTKRAKEILRGLGGRVYDGQLWFEAYPDSLDEEMVELMKASRVSCVELGFQTLSTEGLKAVARPGNLPKFERAVTLLRAAGIRFYVDIIYGLPETTVGDFLATMDYLHERGVAEILVYRLLGLPGSPMMDDVDRYGLVFTPTPPYELLSSDTFSLEDVHFCETFTQTYYWLRDRMEYDLLRRFSRMAGKLSSLVELVMRSGALDQPDGADHLAGVLAGLMREDSVEPDELPSQLTPTSRSALRFSAAG
jgi:anaerobic magnesium-protoporphyrin IX monomethyl ester cyclase